MEALAHTFTVVFRDSPAVSALAGGLVTVAGAVVIGLAPPAFTRYCRAPG